MKTIHIFASASLLAVSFAASAPAFAYDDWATCRALSKQVDTALSNDAGNVGKARVEQRMATQSCAGGLYQVGASHYRKALTYAGTGEAASASTANGSNKMLVNPAQ